MTRNLDARTVKLMRRVRSEMVHCVGLLERLDASCSTGNYEAFADQLRLLYALEAQLMRAVTRDMYIEGRSAAEDSVFWSTVDRELADAGFTRLKPKP